MAQHPRQLQAALGQHAVLGIAAAVEFRIAADGLAGDLVEGDVLRAQARRRGDDYRVAQCLGPVYGPLHGLHAAEAAADHRCPLVDAQMRLQHGL